MTGNRTHSNAFFRQHPGPFNYMESSEGVDGIMTIDCTSTGQYIAAATFWNTQEQRTAEMIAEAAAFGLNMLSSGQTFRWRLEKLPKTVQQFLQSYPGPFVREHAVSEMENLHLLRCTRSGRNVLAQTRRSERDSAIVIETIAEALNALRIPHWLDKHRQLFSAVCLER